VAIHGGRTTDQHISMTACGPTTSILSATGGGNSQSIFFTGSRQEISLEVGNLSIQSETAGVGFNVIPREGGNTFTASFLAMAPNGSLQSDNLTDDLRAPWRDGGSPRSRNMFDLTAGRRPHREGQAVVLRSLSTVGQLKLCGGTVLQPGPAGLDLVSDPSRQATSRTCIAASMVA